MLVQLVGLVGGLALGVLCPRIQLRLATPSEITIFAIDIIYTKCSKQKKEGIKFSYNQVQSKSKQYEQQIINLVNILQFYSSTCQQHCLGYQNLKNSMLFQSQANQLFNFIKYLPLFIIKQKIWNICSNTYIFIINTSINMQAFSLDSQLEAKKIKRIYNLQSMLEEERRTLIKKVSKHNQSLLTSKKYRTYKTVLQARIRMAENFIKGAADSFFTMISDKEFLMITTEVDVIQKLDKFKKNVMNSLQKITHNLDSKSNMKILGERRGSASGGQEEDQQQESEQKEKSRHKARSRNKSKNFKISSDSSRAMVQWLLKNFQNPYPTTEDKQMMAREGKISMMKVNNWFINARERTVKGYFVKDN